MAQMGFFDADKRLTGLSAKGDPLEAILKLMPWEMFRADIEAVVLTADEAKKSLAGRKPIDALVLFRMLVLQSLYNSGLVTKPLVGRLGRVPDSGPAFVHALSRAGP